MFLPGAKGGKDEFASGVLGTKLHQAGKELHEQMKSAAGAKLAFAGSKLSQGAKLVWPSTDLSRQREVPCPVAPTLTRPCPCPCPN
jgi:hypothetical protein